MSERRSPGATRTVGRRRVAISFAVSFSLLLAACGGSGTADLPPSPSITPPMTVTINDQVLTVPAGSTLGQAIKLHGLAVRNGRLLDVNGEVLRPNEYPVRMHVDGKRAMRETKLDAGSVVAIVPGRDRTEDTEEDTKEITDPRPANPQYVVGSASGEVIITRGLISGKVESIEFEQDHISKRDRPKVVALTFDDGPSQYTDRILSTLRKENVKATFFVVGYLAARDPSAIREMLSQGHTVANHTWSHPVTPPFAQFDRRQMENQIVRTNQTLEELGVEPTLFRPPGGSFDADVVEVARRHGLRNVIWSIDTHDFQSSTTPSDIVNGVVRQLKPGAIVLMHDGGGDQSATAAALPKLIREIRKRGYGFVALSENV